MRGHFVSPAHQFKTAVIGAFQVCRRLDLRPQEGQLQHETAVGVVQALYSAMPPASFYTPPTAFSEPPQSSCVLPYSSCAFSGLLRIRIAEFRPAQQFGGGFQPSDPRFALIAIAGR